MKKKLNVGVVVTLSGRWPRELPEKRFKEYGEWTINAFPECNVVSFDRRYGGVHRQFQKTGSRIVDHGLWCIHR